MEGKLQVELAQLSYLLPRLVGQWKHLERLGGGIGTRGPGETQLESDRRMIRHRIAEDPATSSSACACTGACSATGARRAGVPVVALVGYTNAGKTTLLNRLDRRPAHRRRPALRHARSGGAAGLAARRTRPSSSPTPSASSASCRTSSWRRSRPRWRSWQEADVLRPRGRREPSRRSTSRWRRSSAARRARARRPAHRRRAQQGGPPRAGRGPGRAWSSASDGVAVSARTGRGDGRARSTASSEALRPRVERVDAADPVRATAPALPSATSAGRVLARADEADGIRSRSSCPGAAEVARVPAAGWRTACAALVRGRAKLVTVGSHGTRQLADDAANSAHPGLRHAARVPAARDRRCSCSAAASLTDLLDGYIARSRGSQTRLGAFLDPRGRQAPAHLGRSSR